MKRPPNQRILSTCTWETLNEDNAMCFSDRDKQKKIMVPGRRFDLQPRSAIIT